SVICPSLTISRAGANDSLGISARVPPSSEPSWLRRSQVEKVAGGMSLSRQNSAALWPLFSRSESHAAFSSADQFTRLPGFINNIADMVQASYESDLCHVRANARGSPCCVRWIVYSCPDLRCTVKGRLTLGRYVVDREAVTGIGNDLTEVIAIYE